MVTIKFRGIELTVSPDEVGTVMRQLTEINSTLSQRVPKEPPPPQEKPLEGPASYPTRNAVAPRVLNPAAAWPFPVPQKEEMSLFALSPQGSLEYGEVTLRFLRAIEDHSRSGGLLVEQVMPLLGASHPKGVGSKAAVINKVIESLGYRPEDVYSNPRDATGTRHWVGGTDLKAAISALKKGVRTT